METVGEDKIFSFGEKGDLRVRSNFNIRKGKACFVKNFIDLSTKIAALQFKNPSQVLLFRGQKADYMRHKALIKDATNHSLLAYYTSIPPSLFRGNINKIASSARLQERFQELAYAERLLVDAYRQKGFPDRERLKRQRLLRWSILQHYEVCPTPLLDVTQSLRIAISFASDSDQDHAFIFVLGVPNISGAITASAETGLQIVRLASVCPPEAVRPHIQEGYLLGEYPEMVEYDQKALYRNYEIDFGRRLIAKFQFNPRDFRNDTDFPIVSKAALYPDKDDPLFKLTKSIKERIKN